MNIHTITLRTSCLIERAHACAAGFDRIGKTFSAETTRDMAREMEFGVPSTLYEHWIAQQEARLAGMIAQGRC